MPKAWTKDEFQTDDLSPRGERENAEGEGEEEEEEERTDRREE